MDEEVTIMAEKKLKTTEQDTHCRFLTSGRLVKQNLIIKTLEKYKIRESPDSLYRHKLVYHVVAQRKRESVYGEFLGKV